MKAWVKALLALILFFSATLAFAHLKTKGLSRVPQIDHISSDPIQANLWKEKPMVVYFWASWCGICKTYAPLLSWNLRYLGEGIVFLSIEEGEASAEERKELTQGLSQYPVFPGNYHLLHEFDVKAFPTTVFLNRNREIVFSDTGIISPIGFWIRGFLLQFL